MATQKFSNNASSLLAVSISGSDLSVQVASGGGAEFPSLGVGEHFIIAVENATGDIEYMKCTARAGDVMTVVRAQEGSSARAFTASQARVELRATKETLERFVQHDAGVVNRDLTIPNLDVSATLDVTGAVVFSSTLGVVGAVSLSSTLGVTGAATFSSTLGVSGAVTLSSTLGVSGATSLAGLSATTGAFSGAITCTNITPSGNVNASGTVTGARGIFGYDASSAGSVGASDWFRSNGNTGWFNDTHGGGIYMEDSTYVRVYSGKNFHVAGAITATGDITAFFSDERLKTRVGEIENPLAKVCSLEGFYYVENELAREKGYANKGVNVALSAQQVQAVMPEVVSLAPFDFRVIDGKTVSRSGENYLTINYARLVPLLVEAIKELSAQVQELKAKVQ